MKKLSRPGSFKQIKIPMDYSRGLIRLGGYRDGGYVTSNLAVLASDVLISGGVGSNGRFESDFLDLNPTIKTILIDQSFSKLRAIARLSYHFALNLSKGYNSFIEFLSVLRVLNNKNSKLIYKFLDSNYTLSTLVNSLSSSNLFVKLDIEGSEYSQLSSILDIEERITGLCVEFHDVIDQSNINILNKFVRDTSLVLVYESINESSINNDVPSIIELSFLNEKYVNQIDESYLQASCNPGVLSGYIFTD